jgi:zinc/manganese transport system substrate-binding protein
MSRLRTLRSLLTVFLLSSLASLMPATSAADTASAAAPAKPIVVTTTTILDDFVRTLGADAIDARCLLTPGRDPHSYDPTPADIRLLTRADLIVVNGLGFETWLEKLLQNSGTRATVLTASTGIEPLRADDHHDHSAHDHAHHDHGEIDPHAWHDLRHAASYVANIRDALIKLAPASADTINTRATAYLAELTALDTQFRERLAAIPAARRKLVTSHDSLRYLGHAYALDIIPISGLRPDREPSAKQLATIVKLLRRENIRAVSIESTTNPKIPTLLAKEAGVAVVNELYTDSLGTPDSPAPTFLAMARANLETITTALK